MDTTKTHVVTRLDYVLKLEVNYDSTINRIYVIVYRESTLTSYTFYISTLIMKLKMTIFEVCNR